MIKSFNLFMSCSSEIYSFTSHGLSFINFLNSLLPNTTPFVYKCTNSFGLISPLKYPFFTISFILVLSTYFSTSSSNSPLFTLLTFSSNGYNSATIFGFKILFFEYSSNLSSGISHNEYASSIPGIFFINFSSFGINPKFT